MEKTEVKTISYIELNETFKEKAKIDKLKDIHIKLYNELFSAFNRRFWPKYLKISNIELMKELKIKHKKQFIRIREKLIEKGYILYTKGSNQYESGKYELVKLYNFNDGKVSPHFETGTLRDTRENRNGVFESVTPNAKVSPQMSPHFETGTLRATRKNRNGVFESVTPNVTVL